MLTREYPMERRDQGGVRVRIPMEHRPAAGQKVKLLPIRALSQPLERVLHTRLPEEDTPRHEAWSVRDTRPYSRMQ